ncbi:aminotransferase class I/II-fold pyridoxal phosphate-dependent enzyme [Desulfofustis limnaeus]|jgi:alanine-synthesizing transaminase|uniref:Aminotransferase n=1 Tax=Desulfofustis limnaeus TaxID=2740163 RepID=A0ABN6M2L0_9BACT|nr:aminotransferase class I/II-fold pyridoxal phosphate-dependent enzyme [Desulfofustis limnaeus]MDX9895991.1 aminotransferase class I/II-fold pyridoxal phosphate-dependent enzyme [Desulfofustis sp.]BDD85843.1 aminotransferase [Desulfofustis limnaeus]
MKQTFQVRYAERMKQLPPYLFGMINKMKMEKRWQGADVIDLGMGNPIDPTPGAVTEKLCEVAIDPKTHRYPVAGGMKNLKREIALYYERNYGVPLSGGNDVICTIGSKEGISHLCLALLGPGDTVIVPAPAFPIHVYAAVIAGANVLRIPLTSEDAFLAQLSSMCKSLYPGPKLVMLNFPHNPTGRLASKELFAEVVKYAKQYNFMVINDFAYAKITFDGYVAPSFLEVPGAKDVGVEFSSFSKSYNMAGWRLGYCVGNEQIIEGLSRIKGYYDYGIFSAIQVAGIVAMRDCDDDIVEQAQAYQKRRDVLCDGLVRMGWEVEVPKAGMFVWVQIPEPYRRLGSVRFAVEMMSRANVAVAPGAGFGEEGDGYLRLALVENENRIRQALKQIRQSLRDIDHEIETGQFHFDEPITAA